MESRPSPNPRTAHPKKYRLGFSPAGFVAFLLPMIPNVLWALLPPVSPVLSANDSASPIVGAIGTVSQSMMIALLILVINTRRRPSASKRVFAAAGAACLIGYLMLWVLYFTAPITPMLLLMMAVLPSAYFICVGLYLENYPSLVPATLFAVIHTATTATNYF